MHIEVVRSGGFAAIQRHASLDTTLHPDAGWLTALVEEALAPGPPHTGVPDGFSYTITAGNRTVRCHEPHLTPAQRELVTAVLGEGT